MPEAQAGSAAPKGKLTPRTYSDDFVDTQEENDHVLDLTSSNVAALMQGSGIEIISEREFNDKAAYILFMEDVLTIEINETTDKNAAPVVFCGDNGDQRWLPRGIKFKIQRKFIERLAQSHERHYTTVNNPDRDADNGMLTRTKGVQAIGFQVWHDPSPRGRQWLQRVTRSGN